MQKMLVVDGNSLINRAFYGVKGLTTHDGRNTNATYGFINMLHKALCDIKPDFAAIAFDVKTSTFRHEKCDFYKANRKGMPEELHEQLEDTHLAGKYLGFSVVTCPGFEADDILGTLSTLADKGIQVYIMTGDRDSYQLVRDNVNILYVSTKETVIIGENEINEKYGLSPRQLIELKALMGDSSDNIPGVKGVGEKTALDLIQRFESLDGVYQNLETASLSPSLLKKLEDGKEMAYISRFLAEITLQAPIDMNLETYKYCGIDEQNLYSLCERLELFSLIKRLDLSPHKEDQADIFSQEESKYEICQIKSAADIKFNEFCLHADFDTQKLYVKDNENTLFCMPLDADNLYYLLGNKNNSVTLYDIKNYQVYLYTNGKGDIEAKFFDVMLSMYVKDPAGVVDRDKLSLVFGSGGLDAQNPDDNAYLTICATEKLKDESLSDIAAHGQESLLYDIEFPLAIVLSKMEFAGFRIDTKALSEYGQKLENALESRIASIYTLAGEEFNINSPKQLSVILFEKMNLPHSKKTKSGYSTDADSLEKLRQHSPIIDEILEYRLISKLKGTYIDGLLKAVDEDSRLHTKFKQALTLTGRLSSAEPNLQNIPIRTKEGREIRRVFVPSEGKVLVDADYSQIELRLMAALSGDETMINTFLSGRDIHTMTASQVFGVPEDEVTPEMRKSAKAVNFGIIYGISDFSLAGDIKVSKKEAGEYIKRYFERYPKVKEYLDNVKQKAYEDGYVSTLFERRRYIPELKSRLYMQKMFGERVAMNAPIQGTAADIIKIAMINVDKALREQKLDARLILQVHDELIVECSKDDAPLVCEILEKEMSAAADLSVPLEAQALVGKTWQECHN